MVIEGIFLPKHPTVATLGNIIHAPPLLLQEDLYTPSQTKDTQSKSRSNVLLHTNDGAMYTVRV